jgi:peptidoglycan hydrolase-like protein with peptidoglycan-binding domain
VPARAHIAEPAARRRGAGEAKPGRLSFKAFLSEPFRILRTVTPLQAALLCIAVILCISVPVALAASIGASPGPAAPDAQGQGQPAPPPDGYSAASASPDPASSSSPTASPTSTPPPDPASAVIREGVSAPVVAEIQSRLMALGYMEEDEPTEYFGPITSSAVSLFQRQHHLTVDGAMGPESYTLLMSDDAQKYTVMEGASGEDVKELQARLRELGYLDTVTGNFGELTTKAVKNFQECNSLTVDGKVGQKTLDLLYSADVKPYFLKYGEQSDMVKTYQKRLATLGYLTTEPDGKYGKYTVAAVKRFQEINGLIPDGFLGPNTVSLLTSGKAHANALVLGMKGDDVKSMQNLLKALGYMSHVTGYYGSETESAVKAFQKRNGLTVDGTVGKQTMTLLKSGKAKKAASGSSGSSGNNGSSGNSGSGSSSPSSGVEKLISVAESKLGKKYVSGAKGPNTFDCSGFVYYCLNQAGVKQGYLTSDGWAACGKYQKITSISSLKRGDILVFGAHSAGHVGIYLGNGCMIDASSANGKVVKRTGIWSSSYWPGEFICAFRVY